jgi:hypothetical protein
MGRRGDGQLGGEEVLAEPFGLPGGGNELPVIVAAEGL